MPIWLAILGASLAEKMQEGPARQQAAADLQMQFARSLSADVPTYAYQAAQANHQLEGQRGRMVASILPTLLSQQGSAEPKNWATGGTDFTKDPDWYQSEVDATSGRRRGLRMMPGGGIL